MTDAANIARRALPLLDLTDLSENCDEERIAALCRRARAPVAGELDLRVAAVCVWPAFVEQAARALARVPVRVATVVNFPSGAEHPDEVLAALDEALAHGADEIDLVLDYTSVLQDRPERAAPLVARARAAATAKTLKVILETGALGEPAFIRTAARLAIEGGADMLKTSTGKAAGGATPDAVRLLLEAARSAGRPVGVKVSGGVRTTEDAARYLALADEVMGPGWAGPATFRFGASGLLDELVAVIEGRAATSRDVY